MTLNKHMDLSERSLAQANLAMKFLSAVYNFNASILYNDNDEKIITEKSPVGVIYKEKKWNKIKRRKGYIRADQIHDWSLAVCTTWWAGNQNLNHRAYTNQDFLLLLILTGFRREEGETLEWTNVDLKYGTIKIQDPKIMKTFSYRWEKCFGIFWQNEKNLRAIINTFSLVIPLIHISLISVKLVIR